MRKNLSIAAGIAMLLNSVTANAKQNLDVTFMHDGLQVNARLELPDGNGPYQVIIIDPGSGANDRDCTLPMVGGNVQCLYPGLNGDTLRPYKGLSEAFSDSGYAVLTYDKIEYTYPNPGTITFHKLWMPVESAIGYLKTRTDIDTNNIILLGHSEGSSIIPYIARTQPQVKALISLAGPRTPFDSILAYQLKYIAHNCGQDTNAANNQANQVLQYYAAIRSGSWNGSTPPAFGVPASVWSDYLKVIDSVVINYNIGNRPTLFLGLGADINVPIATELSRFQTDITTPADFWQIPGLIHYLCTSTDPVTSRPLTDTIIYWLRKKVPAVSVPVIANNEDRHINVTAQGRKVFINVLQGKVEAIYVYNMLGQIVYKTDLESTAYSFSLAEVPAAVYMLALKTSEGQVAYKIPIQ